MIQISQIANLPSEFGSFKIRIYKQAQKEHAALFSPNLMELIANNEIINVRIHSECLTGDAFLSLKCDCGEQLKASLRYISEFSGLLIYLRQEGRNIGLLNKINAYNLQDSGFDTISANHELGFKADERSYEMAEFILKNFGISNINLLTNNPDKLSSLKEINIIKRIPIQIPPTQFDKDYLRIKKEQMGHLFDNI